MSPRLTISSDPVAEPDCSWMVTLALVWKLGFPVMTWMEYVYFCCFCCSPWQDEYTVTKKRTETRKRLPIILHTVCSEAEMQKIDVWRCVCASCPFIIMSTKQSICSEPKISYPRGWYSIETVFQSRSHPAARPWVEHFFTQQAPHPKRRHLAHHAYD